MSHFRRPYLTRPVSEDDSESEDEVNQIKVEILDKQMGASEPWMAPLPSEPPLILEDLASPEREHLFEPEYESEMDSDEEMYSDEEVHSDEDMDSEGERPPTPAQNSEREARERPQAVTFS